MVFLALEFSIEVCWCGRRLYVFISTFSMKTNAPYLNIICLEKEIRSENVDEI